MSIQGAHWLRTVAANWHTQEDKPWSIQFTSCRQMDKTCTRICFVCLLALPTAARWGDQMRRRRTAHWMGQEEIIDLAHKCQQGTNPALIDIWEEPLIAHGLFLKTCAFPHLPHLFFP
jgi:hypothetical protein